MQDRAQRTRERILDAAAEEFAAHGPDSTTLQAVADRVGMTKGAVYGHFTSKQAVAAALEAHGALTLSALHPDPTAPDPVDTLRRLVAGLGAQLQSDIRLRAALRLRASGPAPHPATALSDLLRHTSRTVQAAQDNGTVASTHPPHLIAGCLLTLACAGAGADAPEELRPRPSDTGQVTDIALTLLDAR
ncbi:helix-turn-helix domain-containing protein [Streptomyces sp. NPDC051987]|uniref:helix-turn-helix domain-containing protein n=1 Tax=Streptomyces sp. NPDC051987 TaxID=3155808 RepID=UPI003448F9F3